MRHALHLVNHRRSDAASDWRLIHAKHLTRTSAMGYRDMPHDLQNISRRRCYLSLPMTAKSAF